MILKQKQSEVNMMNSHDINNESVCKMRWDDEYKVQKVLMFLLNRKLII